MNFFNVLAHEGEEEVVETILPSLDQVIRANSLKFSLIAAAILVVLVFISIIKQKSETLKPWLFWGMVLVILANTLYLTGSTIYLNQVSQTGGPVHWHADFEIWNCGKLVELKNPQGLSNKVGSETVHEHNDQRIHIEGVILDPKQASLGNFFKEVGGDMDSDHLTIPTEDGLVSMKDGQSCPDGTQAKMQVFLYRTEGQTYRQAKLENPQDFVISPQGQVPPGDCLIIEFGPAKQKTDKKCRFLPK